MDKQKKAKLIKYGAIGGGAAAVLILVIVLVTMKKKKTSTTSTNTSTISYKFPLPYYNYVMGTENISTGSGSFYLGGTDPALFDAQWCSQVREQLTFEPVSDGATSDTKIFRIRQSTISSGGYLSYDSTASDSITQLSLSTTNSNQLWAVKQLPSVTSIHIADVGTSAYLGVYNITNVATGLSLTYTNVSGTNKISLATANGTSKNQQWVLAKAIC